MCYLLSALHSGDSFIAVGGGGGGGVCGGGGDVRTLTT